MAFGKKAPRGTRARRAVAERTGVHPRRRGAPVTPKRKRAVRGRGRSGAQGRDGVPGVGPVRVLRSAIRARAARRRGAAAVRGRGGRRLLCFLDTSEETGTGACGATGCGTATGGHRDDPASAPARRPFKHTWRVEQPGHPEIVGRNQWATGDMKEIAGRGTGRFVMELVDSVASLGVERDATAKKARTLEWRAGEQVVMVSQGNTCTVRADWFDRRLAFAFALLGDR
ncbi:hypothetical protein NKH77_23530 [Streptomyces sp. M19]